MLRTLSFIVMLLLQASFGLAQDSIHSDFLKPRPFVALEVGEALFNSMQSISGEVGLRFPNRHQLRLTHMNVWLTEGHLSSGFAGAVKGEGVEGRFLGFEVFYDFLIWKKGLYLGPSVGYYRNSYTHTKLDSELSNRSATIGAAISFQEIDLFRVKGLYYRVSIPFRTPLNPIEETPMGNAIVSDNRLDNNIWLFIGYEF
ncbi:hypothetical protein [Pontibacter sp. G13]|uniref:hypothetical protein n=1 Tax=Pontibacter sp. G13 TaxID=3074898 RepID=UPI002889F866|nr:hypothetical protein [Pontibacter sp. G13]WNJ19162.1 hypothetical protein RJD25_01610 [Pontibacter sp. G13]